MLSLRQHGSYTSKTCRFPLRNISRIRKYIPQDISIVLIKSLVMSRLDYSNGLLYGLNKCTVSGLQAVQNSAARIVTQGRLRDHDSISHALIRHGTLPASQSCSGPFRWKSQIRFKIVTGNCVRGGGVGLWVV